MTDIQNEINHLKSKIYVIDLLHQGEQVEERALYMKQLQELESLKIEELVQAAVKLCDYCCKQKCNKCIFYHTGKHYCMLGEPISNVILNFSNRKNIKHTRRISKMVYEEYARELYNNRGYVFGNTTLHYCESEIYAIKDGDNIILTHAKSPAEAHRNVNMGVSHEDKDERSRR